MTIQSKIRNLNIRGQAFVEFAFILPILLLLVFGIAEFGRFLFLKNTATNGARQGARVAAVTPLDWTTARKAAIFHAATSIKASSQAWQQPDITFDPPEPSTSAGQPSASGVAITVTVSMPFNSVVPNFIPTPTSISASATMRYE